MDKSNDPRRNFFAHVSLEELIAEQGVKPVKDPRTLLGEPDDDPEEAEDMVRAIREWRGHGPADSER